jgi:hypothetical protein
MIFIHFFSFGQNNVYIDAPFVGLPSRDMDVREIDSLKQLPPNILFTINQLFSISMTDFVNNIVFIKGQIVDIEGWAAKDSTFQEENKFVIPKYELFFELRDTTISIKRYCFDVSLNQYGQITNFQWPREGFNKRAHFATGTALKKEAIKCALKKNYNTKECLYELLFDDHNQRLRWYISFLQTRKGSQFNYYEEYKTLIFDVLSKDFVGEMEMFKTAIAD